MDAARRKPAVIAYDICDKKTRGRVYRMVKKFRAGGQKSAHEVFLTQAEGENLLARCSAILDPQKDLFLIAWINTKRNILFLGRGDDAFLQSVRIFG